MELKNLMQLRRQHFFNPAFIGELLFFTATLLLAILVLQQRIVFVPVDQIGEPQGMSPFLFLLAFFFMTGVLLIAMRRWRSYAFLRVIFYVAVVEGLWYTVGSFSDSFSTTLVGVGLVMGVYLFVHTIAVHNTTLVLALAGIGVMLASNFTPVTAIIVLTVLLIYDYIAVNKTKHMVSMFQGMIEKKIPFAIIVPYNLQLYKNSIRLLSISPEYVFLGTGDIVVPLLLIVPAYLQSAVQGLYALAGAVLGLVALYVQFLLRQERKALPGLSMIAGGTILGYLFSLL